MQDSFSNDDQRPDEGPLSARNAALVGAVGLFGMVTMMYGFAMVESANHRGIFFLATPITLVILSLVTNYRPLILATIAICLMVGIVGMFSIGIPIFVMGICLLAWWCFKSDLHTRKPFGWNDLLIANLIVFPVLIYLACILL